MPRAASQSLRETVIPLTLLAGDTVVTFAGLVLGWWLRYASPLGKLGIAVPGATFTRYLPLLLVGVALLVGAFAQFGLYDARLLLRRYQSAHRRATWLMYQGTNATAMLYTDDRLPARVLRDAALRIGNRLPPVRWAVLARLMEAGGLPRPRPPLLSMTEPRQRLPKRSSQLD